MSIIVADDLRSKDGLPARETATRRLIDAEGEASSVYMSIKALLDFALALLLIFIASPAILLATLLIKLTSRGPAFYTQTRMGKGGKPFVIFKLRTMAHNVESLSGVRWAMPNDPRVTKLGRVLRKTHIDELPQLWNVLKGDMSLIGPRPERPEFLAQLDLAIPHYRGRLLVKPGVTGLAQVQLPPDTNLASVRLKVAYDLYYVRHPSLWLDLRILLCTGAKMLAAPFSILQRWFKLPTQETIEKDFKQLPRAAVLAPVRAQTDCHLCHLPQEPRPQGSASPSELRA